MLLDIDGFIYVAFGTGESTLFRASRLLGMWFFTIWMPRNIAIPMFGFIENLLRFLEMWDDNIWFIPRNLELFIFPILSLDLNMNYQVL